MSEVVTPGAVRAELAFLESRSRSIRSQIEATQQEFTAICTANQAASQEFKRSRETETMPPSDDSLVLLRLSRTIENQHLLLLANSKQIRDKQALLDSMGSAPEVTVVQLPVVSRPVVSRPAVQAPLAPRVGAAGTASASVLQPPA